MCIRDSVSTVRFRPRIHLTDEEIVFASGAFDKVIYVYVARNVWDPENLIVDIAFVLRHKQRVSNLKWSMQDQLLAVAKDHGTLQIWDASLDLETDDGEDETSREICNIRGHKGFIVDAEFYLRNPNYVITSSEDQSVKIWDINTIKNRKAPGKKRKRKNKEELDEMRSEQHMGISFEEEIEGSEKHKAKHPQPPHKDLV
eukprot:TRINITY_DN15289_c0_g1_i2.p1 TRINITY_DN15289_c0_g1~~TRINITY_DN15289_c0_g1_i2.p1  ORF type:complete len:200 (-),score=31.43 TRINITY_DN15289_c0_g1_i2:65-664(-)